jgi:preprotein translocase subunit YajC
MDITGFPLLQAANSTGSLLTTFIPFGLVIVIFYFLIIRPQNKKQKDTERMLSALKKGDRVVTIGGVHGVIHAIKEGTVVVKVDENCKLEYNRSAISTVVVDKVEAPKKAKKGEKKEDIKEEIQSADAPAAAVEANDEKK